MRRFVLLLTAGVFAASLATSANAGSFPKTLDDNKSVAPLNLTQGPASSLVLGGLGGSPVTVLLLAGGILTIITLTKPTSGT